MKKTGINPVQKKAAPYSCFTLKIGKWKQLFPEAEYKFMIAKALNCCTSPGRNHKDKQIDKNCQPEFEAAVIGYLITEYKVCLVIEIEPERLDEMLRFFSEKVEGLIKVACERIKNTYPADTVWKETALTQLQHKPIFQKYAFTNYLLINLITGQDVTRWNYNPKLEWLKRYLQGCPFCSVVDHSHAKSPVHVKKIRRLLPVSQTGGK